MIVPIPDIGIAGNFLCPGTPEISGGGACTGGYFPFIQRWEAKVSPPAIGFCICIADAGDRVIHFAGNISAAFSVGISPVSGAVFEPPVFFEARLKDHSIPQPFCVCDVIGCQYEPFKLAVGGFGSGDIKGGRVYPSPRIEKMAFTANVIIACRDPDKACVVQDVAICFCFTNA
jgi:hypothetical protein